MHYNKFSIFSFLLLVSFPPLNARTQSSLDMLPKLPLSKGVYASFMSLSHNIIAPTIFGMLDVGCI